MSGFTLTFETDVPTFGYAKTVALREKVAKQASYLGPWCSRCGKRGKTCKNRTACTSRIIGRPTGKPRLSTLPTPPQEWMQDRYPHLRAGRWGWSGITPEIRQHYAYEVAMGRDALAPVALAA